MSIRAEGPLPVIVDVTDTLSSGWRAGIQRVVVQLISHLRSSEGIDLVPVVWSRDLQGHRRLRPDELDDLLHGGDRARSAAAITTRPGWRGAAASGSATVRHQVGRAVRFAARVVVLVLSTVGIKDAVRDALRKLSLRTIHRDHVTLAVGELAEGSVLFDLDTVWNQTSVDRDALYRRAHAGGAHVAVMVYDLLPVEHPEWFEASLVEVFDTTLTAQATHADLVMAISAASAGSFTTWAASRGIGAPEPVVVGLGADAVAVSDGRGGGAARHDSLPRGVVAGRYVLVVGTVEPRKNHRVLLDAFDRLAAGGVELQLVVVGRPGWENDRVVQRLAQHPLTGTQLHWFQDADDELLSCLYDHALVVAVPSATEGFGLPVIEAFGHGVPVVASDGGALPEAGGELAEYVPPHDVDGWAAALERHFVDPAHSQQRRRMVAHYEPPSWGDTARQVAQVLHDHVRAP